MDSKIVLYSTHCNQCKVIGLMLKKKNIEYEEVYVDPENPQVIKDLGFHTAPILVVDGTPMPYDNARNWIKEQ